MTGKWRIKFAKGKSEAHAKGVSGFVRGFSSGPYLLVDIERSPSWIETTPRKSEATT